MKTLPPAGPAAGPPTWPPSAPPSSRPSKTPATCTSPKDGATTPPPPKPSISTASIRTEADIHGTRRSPAVLPTCKNCTVGQPGQYGEWQSSGTFQLDFHGICFRKMLLAWSPLTESNRRPSPYHEPPGSPCK